MFVRTRNLSSNLFLPIRPQSLCIPFKFMCPFNREAKWKLQIFDPIAPANAIPPIFVN